MSTALQQVPAQLEQTVETPLEVEQSPIQQVVRADLPFAIQIIKVALTFLAFDFLAIASAGLAAFGVLSFGLGLTISAPLVATCTAIVVLGQLLGLWISELYPPVGIHPAIELKRMVKSTFLVGLAVTGCALAFLNNSTAVLLILLGFVLQLFTLPVFRSMARSLAKHSGLSIPFFFLGQREQVLELYRDMNRFGCPLLRPVGRFEDLGHRQDELQKITIEDRFELDFERDAEFLGRPSAMAKFAEERKVYWLLCVPDAFRQVSGSYPSFPREVMMSEMEKQASSGSSLVSIGMANGVHTEDTLLVSTQIMLKRCMDLLIASTACLVLLPVFAVIAALIRLSSSGKVLYASPRIGRNGRIFNAWKFRTMVENADEVLRDYLRRNPDLQSEYATDLKLKYDPRITWIGRILRKTSLDELPQLFNVLMGEMSLVGPRPMLESERQKYGSTFGSYLRVTPGITGLWQISGRNNTTYEDRLKYVKVYVRDWSPWLDLYILMRTIKTVLLCEGAY